MAVTGIQSTLSGIYSASNNSGNSGGVYSLTSSDPVTTALNQANARVQQQLQKTEVQISAFGQAKSSIAQVQSASKAVTAVADPKKAAGIEDVKKALQSFAAAYNSTNSSLNSIAPAGSKSTGSAEDTSARMASMDLRRTLTGGSNTTDLRNMGITANKDGSLSIDVTKLEKAFASNPDGIKKTLSQVGQQFEATASRQLQSSGNIGKAVNSLETRARTLDSQLAGQQTQVDAMQRQLQQSNDQLSSTMSIAASISKYQQIFSS